MKKFIRSSRPKQMTKNLLIFVPLFFTIDTWISYSYTDIQIIISKSIFTFFSFCCCSIIGYQINDFIDRNLDKFHSVKKNRPIAKNEIKYLELLLFIFLIFIVGSCFAYLVNINVLFLFILYLSLSILYSYIFKNYFLMDLIFIVIFYIVRMSAGTIAISFDISIWLYILTGVSSFLIITIKRVSESKKNSNNTRSNISFYKNKVFKKLIFFLGIITCFTYLIYSVSEVFENQKNWIFILTSFFFFMGIIRYIQLTNDGSKGEFPEEIILKDKYIFLSIMFFFLFILLSLI
jgi:4-hydroxybenzoate polyprenyltransferase